MFQSVHVSDISTQPHSSSPLPPPPISLIPHPSPNNLHVVFVRVSQFNKTEWKTAPLAKVQLCKYENQTLEAFVEAIRLYTKFDCPVANLVPRAF